MKIALAGATGVLGQHIAENARTRGHDVVPLDGVQAVVDAASIKNEFAEQSLAFM